MDDEWITCNSGFTTHNQRCRAHNEAVFLVGQHLRSRHRLQRGWWLEMVNKLNDRWFSLCDSQNNTLGRTSSC